MSAAPSETCWKQIGIWGDRSCPELTVHGHCRNCPVYSAGAARLLDTEVSADYLATGARLYAQPKVERRAGGKSAVVFCVGGEWLALPAAVFQEIAPVRPVHSLPHRRDTLVSGIVNVRGELLICVSLAAALGLGISAETPSAAARHAVVGRGADRFVFLVTEVPGIHRYDEHEVGPVPATLAHSQAIHTRGMLQWRERPVGLLDEDLLFRSLNRGLA